MPLVSSSEPVPVVGVELIGTARLFQFDYLSGKFVGLATVQETEFEPRIWEGAIVPSGNEYGGVIGRVSTVSTRTVELWREGRKQSR